MARTQVCTDVRYSNGDLACGSTVAFYTDSAGLVAAVLYANAEDGQTVANPVTVDDDGYITFWTEAEALYFLAEHDDTLHALLGLGVGGDDPPAPSNDFYNVIDYGAVGDGTTDDYTACNAALQAAIIAGGGTVFFPSGKTYYLSTRLVMPQDNVRTLVLSGYGATVKPGAYGFVYFTPGEDYLYHDIAIEGFSFDGSIMETTRKNVAVIGGRSTSGSYGAPLDQCWSNLTFRDMVFENLEERTAGIDITSISAAADAAITTASAHGLSSGGWVYLSGTNSTPVLDGWIAVKSVVNSTQFTVETATSGSGDAGTCQPAYLRYGISMVSTSLSGGDAGTYIQDLAFDNLSMTEGSCLLEVYGGAVADGDGHDDEADIYLDRIIVRNCHHIRPTPNSGVPANSFHIGGTGYGGLVSYYSCSSVNAMDCAYETNSCSAINYFGCYAENAKNTAFYMTNFNALIDPDSQAVNHFGCRVVRSYKGGSLFACRGWTGHGNSVQVGNFLVQGCSYAQTVGDIPPRVNYQGYSSHIYGPKKLIYRDLVVDAVVEDSITSSTTRYMFQLEDGALADASPAEVLLENVVINVAGVVTISSSSYDYYLVPFYLDHPKLNLKVDGMRVRFDITPSQGDFFVRPLFYVSYAGAELSADIKRFVWEDDNCTAAPYILQWASSTATVPVCNVEACDLRGMSIATSRYISASTSLGTYNAKIRTRERNCIYASAPAGTTITQKVTLTVSAISAAAAAEVTTSGTHGLAVGDWVFLSGSNSTPVVDGWRQVQTVVSTTKFTIAVTTSGTGNAGSCQPAYTNKLFHDQDVCVAGGTVTKIELSTDFGATWTETGLTAGIFRLRGGDSICVTNSSAPTVKGVPRP